MKGNSRRDFFKKSAVTVVSLLATSSLLNASFEENNVLSQSGLDNTGELIVLKSNGLKITGTFLDKISHDIPHQNWGVKEWNRDFQHIKSFGGWYISSEISRATEEVIGVFHVVGKQCKDVFGGLSTFILPWIDGKKAIMDTNKFTKEDSVSVQRHEREWDKIFNGIHDMVDAYVFQDDHIGYDELNTFFEVNKKLADKYDMQYWTDAESFDRNMPIRFCQSSLISFA